jgi:hypothetical protein
LTTKQELMKIRSRALRTRIWFRTLSKVERGIIDLTIKCVEKIRSNVLVRTISTIITKLLESLGESFMERAERTGHKIAASLCSLGERWKNKSCLTWKSDKCFVKFLGVNALNA